MSQPEAARSGLDIVSFGPTSWRSCSFPAYFSGTWLATTLLASSPIGDSATWKESVVFDIAAMGARGGQKSCSTKDSGLENSDKNKKNKKPDT